MDTVVPKYKKKRNCPKGEPPSLYPIGIHNGVLKGDSVWVTDEQSIEIISTMVGSLVIKCKDFDAVNFDAFRAVMVKFSV